MSSRRSQLGRDTSPGSTRDACSRTLIRLVVGLGLVATFLVLTGLAPIPGGT